MISRTSAEYVRNVYIILYQIGKTNLLTTEVGNINLNCRLLCQAGTLLGTFKFLYDQEEDYRIKDRNERGIPRALENFVIKNVHSIEQLDILLLLRKRHQEELTIKAIEAVIRTNAKSIAARLEDLFARSLLTKKCLGGESYFRYATTEESDAFVDELARFYETHKHAIIELISLHVNYPPDASKTGL